MVGCKPATRSPVVEDAPAVVAHDAAVVVDARTRDVIPKKMFITGAGRCGECHEKMYDEWEVSAHAQAATSDLYVLARERANDPSCDGCHAPLGAATTDAVASEGVTCDVCHTLREATPSKAGAQFRLAIDDMVKYGPRCDLEDHYFHRMGCSPEHKQATVCGSCHWWEPKGLPVFTEFADWRDGPAAKAGIACQSCHMPKEKASLATGSPIRRGVPHHGLLGLAADLRKRALAVRVAVRDDGGRIVVDVALTNATAGHHVPAGLPARRIVVRARVRDRAGAELGSRVLELGRTLVDAAGAEAPFWRATRASADTRIAPRATWTEQLAFGAPGGGTVEVEIVYRALSSAVARQLGVTVEEELLAIAKVPFGAPGPRGRARLPRTITIGPPRPGKRPRGKGAP